MEAGRIETDMAKRKEIYDQIQKIIIDDVPYIYLYNPAKVHAWQPYVRGYKVYGDGAIHLKSVWLQK
jgi:peptide/nickel transport system substrate-binding protein